MSIIPYLVLLVAFTTIQNPIVEAYPNAIVNVSNNKVVFSSGEKLLYDDFKKKSIQELLDNPDIEDQLKYQYNQGAQIYNTDAGRIRNELFFKTLYGKTKNDVVKNLQTLTWCPKLVNKQIQFNTRNGAYNALKSVSEELDKHVEWKKYLENISGTFNWRYISGTKRLSAHSFGITIDLNTKYSNYWQWDSGSTHENAKIIYKNQIPLELVAIFEKNGFIWGGRWKHYDTMHFEYRPEILLNKKR